MARRRRSIYQRYAPQAAATAALASSPERRGLLALIADLQGQRGAEISAAHTTSRSLQAAVHQADPAVQKIYAQARAGLTGVTGDYSHPASQSVAGDFAKLGPAAGSIAEAARAEADAAQRRTTEAETRTRVDLQGQGTRAAEGEVFAVRAANDRFSTETGKVLRQLTGVDQEQGVRAAAELGRLVTAAQGRSTTRRGQTLSHQDRVADRTSRETIAAARKQAAKTQKKWVSPSEQRGAAKDFGAAKVAATGFKATRSRDEAKQIIMSGRPSIDLGGGVKTPAIKAVTDEVLVNAALDEVYGGHVSRSTTRHLHKRGIKVSPLGATTYAQWKRRNRPGPYAPAPLSPGANGQNRPT